MSITGFDVKGKQVPTYGVNYAPQGKQNQPLKFVKLPNTFRNLANVSIGVAVSEPLTERTYIGLDDVKHTNYS